MYLPYREQNHEHVEQSQDEHAKHKEPVSDHIVLCPSGKDDEDDLDQQNLVAASCKLPPLTHHEERHSGHPIVEETIHE